MFNDRLTIALEGIYAPNIRARGGHINNIQGRFALIYKLLENDIQDFKKSTTIAMKLSSLRGI